MKQYRQLVKMINNVYLWCAVLFLIITMIASILQVFTRTVMNASMGGTEEAARYAFIWMSFLGASVCVSNHSHASVDMLNTAMPGKLKQFHMILIHIIMAVFAVVLIFHGGRLLGFVARQLSPTLRLPMNAIYAACPLGALGILLNCIAVIFEEIEKTGTTGGES